MLRQMRKNSLVAKSMGICLPLVVVVVVVDVANEVIKRSRVKTQLEGKIYELEVSFAA